MRISALYAGLLIALSWSAAHAAGAPVAQYLDLDSAPAGAFVTVWGKSFGSTVGSVTAGGTATATSDIITWNDSKIEFKLPSGAGNGITVTTNAGSMSNTLPFATRTTGRIFFVSTSGNNSNSGASVSAPWRDLTKIMNTVKPGDIVYVRAGKYTELQDTSWSSVILVRPENNGSKGLPIAVVAYPGEAVTLGSGSNRRAFATTAAITDWTIAKFNLVASENAASGTGTRIRIIGNSASNVPSPYGTFEFIASNELAILGNTCTSCGASGNKLAHSFYYGGYGSGSNVEFGWNVSRNQRGGRGIQIYGHTTSDVLSGLSIHDNIIDGTPYDCILVGLSDATSGNWIKDAVVYNNIATRCGDAGIQVNNPGISIRLLHNTIYSSVTAINLVQAGNMVVANNIFASSGKVSVGGSTSLQWTNNGYSSTTIPGVEAKAFQGDPQFTDAAGGDFSLRAGSPFIGKGIVLSPLLPTISVPASSTPDLGALGWKPAAATLVPRAPSLNSIL